MKSFKIPFFLLLVLSLFYSTSSVYQESSAKKDVTTYPVAIIILNNPQEPHTYTFTSNLNHEEYKIPLFIKRMKNKYGIILELIISYPSQEVIMTLSPKYSRELLDKIIRKFKYSGYEIK